MMKVHYFADARQRSLTLWAEARDAPTAFGPHQVFDRWWNARKRSLPEVHGGFKCAPSNQFLV